MALHNPPVTYNVDHMKDYQEKEHMIIEVIQREMLRFPDFCKFFLDFDSDALTVDFDYDITFDSDCWVMSFVGASGAEVDRDVANIDITLFGNIRFGGFDFQPTRYHIDITHKVDDLIRYAQAVSL